MSRLSSPWPQSSAGLEASTSPQKVFFIKVLLNVADVVRRWLYSQFVTSDANYRMKNKDRGIKNDPPLGDGWGHWVPEGPYQSYIAEYGYQVEVSFVLADAVLFEQRIYPA
jgi:hypothetical protein